MKKIINSIYIILGIIFLAIGGIGVIVPILPTTPFLLLTAILFARGSERFHTWFLSTKLYKKYIEDFIKTKSMTKKEKIKALGAFTSVETSNDNLLPIETVTILIIIEIIPIIKNSLILAFIISCLNKSPTTIASLYTNRTFAIIPIHCINTIKTILGILHLYS